MPTTRVLVLTEEQHHQLTDLRDASPKPYLRERAAALLKIQDSCWYARRPGSSPGTATSSSGRYSIPMAQRLPSTRCRGVEG